MTTEDDFQRQLDANPEDAHTRLVFADWLDEQGDPRAAGYRALGRNSRRPVRSEPDFHWWHTLNTPTYHYAQLPTDWFGLIEGLGNDRDFKPTVGVNTRPTRRYAEDAAARAFAELPPARQTELLAGLLRL